MCSFAPLDEGVVMSGADTGQGQLVWKVWVGKGKKGVGLESLRSVHGHKRCSVARTRSRLSEATSMLVLARCNGRSGRR